MKTLQGPDDVPAPAEEAAIERIKTRTEKARETIDWSLTNSAARSRRLLALIARAPDVEKYLAYSRDLEIERTVQDRLLRERG